MKILRKIQAANIIIFAIFLSIVLGVYSNIDEQNKKDRSKIPPKVELSNQFQRWITNVKNKKIDIDADDFRLIEENEIYNTKWMKVYSIDDPNKKAEYDQLILEMKNTKKVVFSPSEREFLDYRNIERGDYKSNEVHFYGLKDDKIIDARLLDCSVRANCYYDRAYFLDNDVFVISEVSRNIDKKDETTPICPVDQTCTYTFKVHVVDLKNNSRLIYESKPFEDTSNRLIQEL